MAFHPWNDKIKVKLDTPDKYGYGVERKGFESGVVVEVPSELNYVGLHSMVLESSFMNQEKLSEYLARHKKLVGKRIIWEALQDRGRVFKESGSEDWFVHINMSDVLGVADSVEDVAEFQQQPGFSDGGFAP